MANKLLPPASRFNRLDSVLHIAVALGCLHSCGRTAPLPHRRESRHHLDDIKVVAIQCHYVLVVTVTEPERGTVTQDWKLGPVFGLIEVFPHGRRMRCLSTNVSTEHEVPSTSLNACTRLFVTAQVRPLAC
jgi:hypothetical protein